MITVPLKLRSKASVTRATVGIDGEIRHNLPPEIHGDPLNRDGILCFYNFGWDFVESLTHSGFEDSGLSLFWEPSLGYLGGYQFIITAQKPSAAEPTFHSPRRACTRRVRPGSSG
jgi:hypothetical protein